MNILTTRMIRDMLHFKGPMSYGDLLHLVGDSKGIANLSSALELGLSMGDIKAKYVQVEGFSAEVFYTEWKE